VSVYCVSPSLSMSEWVPESGTDWEWEGWQWACQFMIKSIIQWFIRITSDITRSFRSWLWTYHAQIWANRVVLRCIEPQTERRERWRRYRDRNGMSYNKAPITGSRHRVKVIIGEGQNVEFQFFQYWLLFWCCACQWYNFYYCFTEKDSLRR